MNIFTLTLVAFIIGIACAGKTMHSQAAMEVAIIEAYNIGLAECPMDTHCIEHGSLRGLVRLTYNDIKEIIE